jgi:hypothetical protein
MASVLDQLPASTLSLVGNNLTANPNSAAWGYPDSTNQLQPDLSALQYTYSVDSYSQYTGKPNDLRIVDYNRAALGGVTTVRPPAQLDELDSNAPNNFQAGNGGVVSQIYKSSPGRNYRDLGPQPGRY